DFDQLAQAMVIFRKLTCVVTFIVSSMNSSIAGMKDISRLRCVVRQKSTGVRRLWAARDALSNILLRQNAICFSVSANFPCVITDFLSS
ncbi:TPA: hypothetical protein ACK3AG_005635, partial [Klebsiella pneumoniae]